MTTLTKIRLDGVEYDLGGTSSGSISVEDQTLVLTGWMSPVVPITVVPSDNQYIEVSSDDTSFEFDNQTSTGWIAKGATLSITVSTGFPNNNWLAGDVTVNGTSLETTTATITVDSNSLEISAEPAEQLGRIFINMGSYNGGVGYYQNGYGYYQNGYGSLTPNPIGINETSIYFTQITSQQGNEEYTLAVKTSDSDGSFTLLDDQGNDVLNNSALRAQTAQDMYTAYQNGSREWRFFVRLV